MSKAFVTKFLLEEKVKAKKNFVKQFCINSVYDHFTKLGVKFFGFRPMVALNEER